MNGNERRTKRKWMEMKGKWKWNVLGEAANLLRLPHKSTTRPQNRRFVRVFARHDLKIDVSCEASVDFHDMSENATPATEFAPWHHFAQRWQCDSQKNTQHEAARWCKSIAPATQNRRGHAQKTRFGATSCSRDKGISVLGRKSRKAQKTSPRAFPLGRELTTTRRRADDEPTTTRRRADDDTTTSRRRHDDDTTQTTRTQVQPPDPQL